MIESVQARQLGARDFYTIYTQLCALQDSCPLTSVKAHLSEGALDLNVDRIRLPDWGPIWNSLRINKNLRRVSFKSYYQKPVRPEGKSSTTGVRRRLTQKPPPIFSKDATHKMCTALRECLQTTDSLDNLSLQGIPLSRYDMQNIAKGLYKIRILQHLSLEYCRLSSTSVEMLCQGILNSPSLKAINLTGCGVTKKGAEAFAKLVKHQSTTRHSEAWKDSLRYRRPNLDQMPGLRRITLNNNPLINDAGALLLADALKDDLWLKALDMQHCGISNVGATAILDALRGNSTIVVLDIRRNPLVDHRLLKDIIEQVLINGEGREEEYPWLLATSMDPPQKTPSKVKKKRKRRESKPSPAASSVTVHKAKQPVTRPGPGFIPWRSAARAEERQRSATNLKQPGQVANSQNAARATKSTSSIHVHRTPIKDQSPTTNMTSMVLVEDSVSSTESNEETTTKDESMSSQPRNLKQDKEIKVQLEELSRRLDLESKARAAADAQIVELTVENSRLKRHLDILGGSRQTRDRPERLDEDLLKTVEDSFQKFHCFLDLLRDAGLGQLCSLVGLSSSELENPTVTNILKSHKPSSLVLNSNNGIAGHTPFYTSKRRDQQQYQHDYSTHIPQEYGGPDRRGQAGQTFHGQISMFTPRTVTGTQSELYVPFNNARTATVGHHGLPGKHGTTFDIQSKSMQYHMPISSHYGEDKGHYEPTRSHCGTTQHPIAKNDVTVKFSIPAGRHTETTESCATVSSSDPIRHPRQHQMPISTYGETIQHNLPSPNHGVNMPYHMPINNHDATVSNSDPMEHLILGSTYGETIQHHTPSSLHSDGIQHQIPISTNGASMQHHTLSSTHGDTLQHRRPNNTLSGSSMLHGITTDSHGTIQTAETDSTNETEPEISVDHKNSKNKRTLLDDLKGVQLITIDEEERVEINRNNNGGNCHDVEGSTHGASSGARNLVKDATLITPDDLRQSRLPSENYSFHALNPEEATLLGTSQGGVEDLQEPPEEGEYTDDDFDSSGSEHSGVRTSTPDKALEQSRDDSFDKSSELQSQVEGDHSSGPLSPQQEVHYDSTTP